MRSDIDIRELEKRAKLLRAQIVENSHKTKTPHLGSCLSCVDILVAAYFGGVNINPAKPDDPDRDRFILSKGHGAPALFYTLAMRGFYPYEKMSDYGEDGSLFAEHPPIPGKLPGIEAATGSLGHGLPIGLGMALSARIQKRSYNVVALLSDGECNEGSVWEAAMLAAGQKLGTLAVIVDYNKWQATGRSQETMALEPLAEKWRAFGWTAHEVDGHDMAALVALLAETPDGGDKPVAIVAHTVKGKGVSFMEDDNNWHYRIPTAEEVEKAKIELEVST
ncbi:MAG: transketolase [Nitrospinota bacterium]|nr:transketolase [Nitrospinota bacterium]